ncbi:pilus assembly PilX family protein, partial [Microbulbifer sp.]|uniref:pilus assembly PilX family protein n=1 Tax=Microbulbifer sp. TaxID=1908541 RepID=UPI002F93865D
MQAPIKSIGNQRGAVLVVSLIILLVLTLIGVSTARTLQLEEKMTFASRDAKVALEVAEALVRQGERYIDGLSTTGNFNSQTWLYKEGDAPNSLYDANTWDETNSKVFDVPMKGPDGQSLQGKMYIEMAGVADK